MKNIVSLFLIFSGFLMVAQNSAVTNAILYQREGDLVKALTEINKASEHEKTKGAAKTWYYKGVIYRDIYVSESSPAKTQVQDALLESTTFFQKAIKLDVPNGEYRKLAKDQLNQNWVDIINRGTASYQSKRYQDAITVYKVAQEIKPADTIAYVYALAAADAMPDKVEVQRNLDSLIKIQPSHKYALSRIIQSAELDKKYDVSLKYSQKALEYYPNELAFEQGQYTGWVETKQYDKAQEWLNVKLKAKPFDGDYLLWQALLYAEQGNKDQELLYYQKLIALEPHHLAANFNSALIYLDKGNKLAEKNDPSYKNMYQKSLDHAKRAKALADEDEQKRIQQLISNLESLK